MHELRGLMLAVVAVAGMQLPGFALGQSSPTSDIPNARDSPLLRRYEGSFIVDYGQKAFDELELPLSRLEEVRGKRDSNQNIFYAPEHMLSLQGKLTRIVYIVPTGRSPVEVLSNYEEEAASNGGQTLFKCREQDCGGDNRYGIRSTGWHQNMLLKVYPVSELRQQQFSTGDCALREETTGTRYVAMAVPTPNGQTAHVAVVTYQVKAGSYCKVLNERTVVVVVIVEPKAREQRMVTVGVPEMNNALSRDGRIVLHNILFDFDKADIKPESRPQLDELVKLLQASPSLRMHVVGHTDNQGQLAYNMDLSRRRAQSVVQALVQGSGIAPARLMAHGAGPIAPVAPNADEAGRARNRRTELVPQ